MTARSPRHLADGPGQPRRWSRRLLVSAGLLVLALAVAVVALRGGGGGRRAPAPTGSTGPRAASGVPTTTLPAARPLRPMPGNLLANADFEQGLEGWAPLGNGRLARVAGGSSGRWAAAIRPGQGGAGAPGLSRRDLAASVGTTYVGSVWVRAAAPGTQVVLALREYLGGREVSSDVTGYNLTGDGWQAVTVEHRARVRGAGLAIEVTGATLPGDQPLLVDAVDLHPEAGD
jgi:hypothetical protein